MTRIHSICWGMEHIKCMMKYTYVFMDDVENDMRNSEIVKWRQGAPYGDAWRRAVREALIFIG